jgi:hypothetical protein
MIRMRSDKCKPNHWDPTILSILSGNIDLEQTATELSPEQLDAWYVHRDKLDDLLSPPKDGPLIPLEQTLQALNNIDAWESTLAPIFAERPKQFYFDMFDAQKLLLRPVQNSLAIIEVDRSPSAFRDFKETGDPWQDYAAVWAQPVSDLEFVVTWCHESKEHRFRSWTIRQLIILLRPWGYTIQTAANVVPSLRTLNTSQQVASAVMRICARREINT